MTIRDGAIRGIAMTTPATLDRAGTRASVGSTGRDPREREDDTRERDRDSRDRHHDPRDVFLDILELPRGLEREIVLDGDHRYELNGDESRALATAGAFRVVSERDLFDARDRSSDT